MTDREHEKWEQEMSAQFNVMMDEIRSQPLPEDSLERSLEAAEAIVMTKAAYKRGAKNAAFVSAIVYPIVAAVAFAISRLLDVSLFVAFMGASGVIFVVLFAVATGAQVLGRSRCGDVLIDCGPFPAKNRFLVMSAVMFLGSIGLFFTGAGILLAYRDTVGIFIVVFSVLLFMVALYCMFIASGRLLICENGVFQYWALLRWNKIESYRWEGITDATLMLQVKGRFALLKRGALPFAIEQKDEVEALLQQHVGESPSS